MEFDSREAVAVRLEAVRKFYEVKTRREFAESAGLTEQMYSDWMNGRRDVSRAAARKLRDRYLISLEFIYFGNKGDLPHKMAMVLLSRPSVRSTQKSIGRPDTFRASPRSARTSRSVICVLPLMPHLSGFSLIRI